MKKAKTMCYCENRNEWKCSVNIMYDFLTVEDVKMFQRSS